MIKVTRIMRVAVDTGPLSGGHAVRGIGVHTRELLQALYEKTEKLKDIDIDAVDFTKTDLSKYDAVHYPYFHPFFLTLPFKKPARKLIVTIHDLIPLIFPKQYPPGIKGRLRFWRQQFLVKKADAVITISETSKKDIVRFLGIPPEKVYVVYLAPRSVFRKMETGKWKAEITKRYTLPQRFVLYVGDINYNKNIPALIKACQIADVPLVICGKQALDIETEGIGIEDIRGPQDWFRFLFNIPHPELAHYRDLLREFRKNKKIIRLGFVPDEDLVAIFNLASVYAQPSFYEGFGLPVLEAMACGVPVIASDISAHIEIAGDAVLYVNPRSASGFADEIRKVIKNPELAERLRKKGGQRVKDYSWVRAAEETLKAYAKINTTAK